MTDINEQYKLIGFKRRGNITWVTLGGEPLGAIVRKEGSDSSPRGGAYRTFHNPITAAGERLGPCWSRKEAVEALLHVAGKDLR